MRTVSIEEWKQTIPEFVEKTEEFYRGELAKPAYKSFSGYYGSYAQRSGQESMLRLRMTAGRVDRGKLKFIADTIRENKIRKLHFTTCQTIQLHDLTCDQVCSLMPEVLEHGIIPMGGGGDYPRNVMCSPLSGVEKGEYFDVQPWAAAAAQSLMTLVTAEKMPRKLKVGFSNSPLNATHATYRDLGFVARPDGTFDVYSAGGLGNNPKMGVRVAEQVAPDQILYYIKAMWLTFRTYGDYKNRGRARTRYLQEILGGAENYAQAYQEKLAEVRTEGEDLTIRLTPQEQEAKQGDGSEAPEDFRVIAQKQEGLYAVCWHPVGGTPTPEEFCRVADWILATEGAQLRLGPDETAYVVNLTGREVAELLKLIPDSASSAFEASVACIGASVCQVGIRDSQALLKRCVEAVREAKLPADALPQIHISGCPSSCGTHQTAAIGFRGAARMVDKKPQPAFLLVAGGVSEQGEETMGEEIGTLLEEEIPAFLVRLGSAAAQSGMSYEEWLRENPNGLREIAAEYL
ncbi:MAG: nitrite/sulfite reductase [Eubacteriales bacterium]|nr:nitrite/sulfite reductase [Eubacteriales bacterium]